VESGSFSVVKKVPTQVMPIYLLHGLQPPPLSTLQQIAWKYSTEHCSVLELEGQALAII
jgi:hypothetical protein